MMLSNNVLVKVSNEDIKPDGSFDIPEGVTRIRAKAFFGCGALKAITIPSRVTEIGAYAFKRCFSLHIIALPADIKIDENAFLGCEATHSVVIFGNDNEIKKQVIQQLPRQWHNKIILAEHADDALQLVHEQLSNIVLVPEINPLHLFLSHDARTTKAKIENRDGQQIDVEYSRLPDDVFHHINTFLGNDNISYKRAAMLMYREPLPKIGTEMAAYKDKLEHSFHHAIEEPLQVHLRFRQQLKDILTSEKKLRNDGHIDAADAMQELFQTIYASYKANYASNVVGFLKESSTAINETRRRLDGSQALNYPAAIAATFFGSGVVSFVDESYRRITGKRHSFFQSAGADSIDALEDGLKNIAQIQLG